MNTRLVLIALLWSLCSVTVILAEDIVEQQWDALSEPTAVFGILLHGGDLPDVEKGRHGEFFTALEPSDTKPIYPMTVKVTLTIKGGRRRFYLMRKEQKDGLWLFTRAWITSASGEEHALPLPKKESQIKANNSTQPRN